MHNKKNVACVDRTGFFVGTYTVNLTGWLSVGAHRNSYVPSKVAFLVPHSRTSYVLTKAAFHCHAILAS